MRLILVRHGEPDYQNDCLTPTGREQAAAAARRLAGEGIREIYSSSNGRARETASYTAEALGLPVTVLDFMHEIAWRDPSLPEDGHPWYLAQRMLRDENFDFSRQDWRQHPYFADSRARACCDAVTEQFDAFLAGQGYRHEGRRFFCTADEDKTVALFSHGGSGGAVLAHLLSLPIPQVFSVMPFYFTSITVIEIRHDPGQYVLPRLSLFNDKAHLRRTSDEPTFQQNSP